MTDGQIKKALLICGTADSRACKECPVDQKLKDDCQCGTFLAKKAFDMIEKLELELQAVSTILGEKESERSIRMLSVSRWG